MHNPMQLAVMSIHLEGCEVVARRASKRALQSTVESEAPTRTAHSQLLAIVSQHNHGVLLFATKEYASAERYFLRAMDLLDPQGVLLPPASKRSRIEQAATPAVDTLTPLSDNAASTASNTLSDSTTTSPDAPSTASAASKPKPPLIDTSMDLDTLMRDMYFKAELVNPNESQVAVVAATILYNLAQLRRVHQDYPGAWTLFQRALHLVMHGTPPQATTADQTIVIPTLHNIGWLLYRQGNVADARIYFEMTLSHCQALLGPRSLSVGVTLNFLGVLHYASATASSESTDADAAASQSAVECVSQALDIFVHYLGADTPVVARLQHCLGRVWMQRKEFALSLQYLASALKTRRAHWGMDSVEYATTAYNVGQCLHQMGDHEGALQMYQQFLYNPSIQTIGQHRDVALCLSGIAQIHEKRKEYDQAQRMYEQSLAVGCLALGDDHPEVALLLNRLGNFYFDRQIFDHALKAYQQGLRIEKLTCEASHPNVIVTTLNIGEIFKRQREFHKAIPCFTEAMAMQRTRYGTNCTQVATVLNTLGLIHDQLGETTSAMKYLQEALVMRRVVLGDDHLDVSASLANIGTMLSRNDMLHNALELFSECLRIRLNKLGSIHRSVSLATYNLGLCHHLLGNFKEAVRYFKETLRIERAVLGEDHRDVALTLYKLGEAYKMEAEIDVALDYYEQSLAMERRLACMDHLAVAQTLNEIGNIHLFHGNVPLMMQSFVESARMFQQAGRLEFSVTLSPDLNLTIGQSDSLAAAAA